MSKDRKLFPLAPAVCVFLAILSVSARAETCPDGDALTVPIEVRVTISPPAVSVDRDAVTVFHRPEPGQPRRVCWTVSGLSSTTRLQIEPKVAEAADPFPVLIRTLTGARTFANSGNPTKPTTWRYGLRLVGARGETMAFLDPMVIVKGRGD